MSSSFSGGNFPGRYVACAATQFFDFNVTESDETVTIWVTSFSASGTNGNYSPAWILTISDRSTGITVVGGGPGSSQPGGGIFPLPVGQYRLRVDFNTDCGTWDNMSFSADYADTVSFANLTILPGVTQSNPVVGQHNEGCNAGCWGFIGLNILAHLFFCPPPVNEFSYQMTGNSHFTQIMTFPTGFSDAFEVVTEGQSLGSFTSNQSLNFVELLGHGVSSFNVRNIMPAVDPDSPTSFPLQLDFDTATADFRMVAVPAPTPTPTPAGMIAISGTMSYCSNPSSNPVPNVALTLTGSGSGSTLSDGSGNYQFSSLAAGGTYTVTPTKNALPPGSTGISTFDVLATLLHYLNLTPIPAGCRLTAADVNGDSNVNTVDVLAIQRFYLGLTTGTANVGKYSFTPASSSYPAISGDQTGQNYDALVLGDVASSFVHRTGSSAHDDDRNARGTDATVRLPKIELDRLKGNFTADVATSTIDATRNLVGFQGDFTFDERVVKFQNEPVQKAGLTGGNWNVSGNVLPGAGPIRTLRISAYSTDLVPLSGSGTLFQLRMLRPKKVSQNTQLVWATWPNNFIFIDADLNTRKPAEAVSGVVRLTSNRR